MIILAFAGVVVAMFVLKIVFDLIEVGVNGIGVVLRAVVEAAALLVVLLLPGGAVMVNRHLRRSGRPGFAAFQAVMTAVMHTGAVVLLVNEHSRMREDLQAPMAALAAATVLVDVVAIALWVRGRGTPQLAA